MMVCCCIPLFDLGWESPAAPCKSQHCWQPNQQQLILLGKRFVRKVLSSPYPYAFCSHYIYSFTCFLFISVTKFMCESPELRKISLFLPLLPPPPREDTLKCLSISLKRAFLHLLAFPCCSSLLFGMNYVVSSVLSTSPVRQCAKRCMQEKDKWRERKWISGY